MQVKTIPIKNLKKKDEDPQDDLSKSPAYKGELEISGSSPDPESDDDVDEAMRKVTGNVPKKGETIGDIINKAEEEDSFPTPPKKKL